MRNANQRELKGMYGILFLLFLFFLFLPIGRLLYGSFVYEDSISLQNYTTMLSDGRFITALKNSFTVSSFSAFLSTIMAFLLAYTLHYTNIARRSKKFIRSIAVLPMLLPTITYGFAILYTLGKQGYLTRLFHTRLFDIYGFGGLTLGYVIYTLPIAFLLADNAMKYIDKKFILVSKIMRDSAIRRFWMSVLAPMIPTLAAAFLQSFFLSFTDFGIPAAVGGEYEVVALTLYNEMLGAMPNFQNGAVTAVIMLLPSLISILLLNYLERYNIRYTKSSSIELPANRLRDGLCTLLSYAIIIGILMIFAVIVILPFVKEWPYEFRFTLQHVVDTITQTNLLSVYRNSLIVSIGTAIGGTLIAYGSALITARSTLPRYCRKFIEALSSITNTIPGMVLGIAYLFAFSATSLQSTYWIILLCNMIHFFATPYVMAKSALTKMNASYETTAMLMGDSWFNTIRRVIVPNSKSTILEMFSYYFINSMVTISALIFLVGAKTAVLTTKIKELQHFAKFDQIFVLSLVILMTNLLMKGLTYVITQKRHAMKDKKRRYKKYALLMVSGCILMATMWMGGDREPVIIYSNADEEALLAIRKALDENGFANQYILQSFGTSELGGKIMAEGTHLEANIVTMSTYYIDYAQEKNDMFEKLTFPTPTLKTYSDYDTPLTALEGSLIVNTSVMRENHLPQPTSLKDLMNPVYKGFLSIPDIQASSTGWLLVQAIIDNYGVDEGERVLKGILANVGPHIEASGSGPLKKVRSGEVAIAYGLRHQALADKKKGLPIDCIDPIEGNYAISESIAIVKKDEASTTAMAMARCMMEKGRKDLLRTYPTPLYEGESGGEDASTYPKIYKKPLSVELLNQHQSFFERCRKKQLESKEK